MLYLTTSSNCESYTAAKTLTVDTAPDGGLFVPFQIPKLTANDLHGKTQAEIIAYVLSLFFRTKLTKADVETCIGTDGISTFADFNGITGVDGIFSL